jgi:hypothetical protein
MAVMALGQACPPGTGGRNVRSKIRWFTGICNSHYVSHFAAFFIDARAKRSVVAGCQLFAARARTALSRGSAFSSGGATPRVKGVPPPRQRGCVSRGSGARGTPVNDPSAGSPVKLLAGCPPTWEGGRVFTHLRRPCYDFYFL